jgi:phytoene/squalene synthetase
LEDLRRFRVREEDLAGPHKPEIAELLAFEAARARKFLVAGLPLRSMLRGRAGMSVALYARGGLAALDALERAQWDVFSSRPAPSRLTFVRLALREVFRR